MDIEDLAIRLRNIDERTARIEQVLPTLATRDDFNAFPTRDDLKAFATRDDLKAFPTRDDLKAFATKDDLERCATKDDLTRYATLDDIRAEGDLTRQHFNAVAERIEERVRLIAEGHDALVTRADALDATSANHEQRLTRLETIPRSPRRR